MNATTLNFRRSKVESYRQKDIGWPQDGFINKALLEELRKRKPA